MSISSEAVEAAAKVIYEADWFGPPYWESLDAIHPGRLQALTHARAALSAAAPHLVASDAPLRINQELLDAQRAKGWTDWHPEDYCHRCYEGNVSWYVDTPPWTDVMRGGDADGWGKWQEIICIPCFTALADEHYGAKQAWTITRDRSSYHLSRVAP